MNWTIAGIIYLTTVPVLLFLASKVDNRSVYMSMLWTVVALSFIPLAIGVNVLRITFSNLDWSFWMYLTAAGGLYCILFGVGILIPVYWLMKK